MGYRGKTYEQGRARDLRAEGWTYSEIVEELGVAKSSVSTWCRDVEVDEEVWATRARANHRRGNLSRRPSSLAVRKQAEVDAFMHVGRQRLASMSEQAFLAAGAALYAGEGAKRDGAVRFTNSDPRMVHLFVRWFRFFFAIDETRLRARLYLHADQDLAVATAFWSQLTEIPQSQFGKPYRAVPDPSIRRSKHPMGCMTVVYSSAPTHRAVMGLVHALLACDVAVPG